MAAKYPEEVQAAITAAEALPAHRLGRRMFGEFTSQTSVRVSDLQWEVFEKKYGEIVLPTGSATVVRRWSVRDQCGYDNAGALAARRVSASGIYAPADGVNTDICAYCGSDNGPDGEFRQGFDCGVCGGN